jgi:hypothetical protein
MAKQQANEVSQFEQTLNSQEAFFLKYRKQILIAVAAVIVIIAGIICYKSFIAGPRENKASTAIAKAQEAFAQQDFQKALNGDKTFEGFRKHGLERYSVTFIDNHDTFDRGGAYGDDKQFTPTTDLSTATNKDYVLQASAYMLMMPGVPCVFYPHWASYKDEINELIAVRKQAGIHSQSQVLAEESGQYKYHATIQGHRGKVIVRVGKYRSTTLPEGYELAVEGGDRGAYTVYIQMEKGIETSSLTLPSSREEKKFLKDGKLYLMYEGQMYDVQGRRIN